MRDISEIPGRDERLDEVLTDAFGQYEELTALHCYLEEVLAPPFAATWHDPDEPGHAEPVTVLRVADVDDRRGVLLQVRRGTKERRLAAHDVWATDEQSVAAQALDDYRYWIHERYGLAPGYN